MSEGIQNAEKNSVQLDEWCCILDIYELWGYMACSIILFKTHFNWHLAHSPEHNRICYDTEGKLKHFVEALPHILPDAKVNSSPKESKA